MAAPLPGHIQAYLEVAAGCQSCLRATQRGVCISELIKRARESQDRNVVPLSRGLQIVPERPRLTVRAWAASFAGLALVSALACGSPYTGPTPTAPVSGATYGEAGGWLNYRAQCALNHSIRLSRNSREIDLSEGQALFHVAKTRPNPLSCEAMGRLSARSEAVDVYRKGEWYGV